MNSPLSTVFEAFNARNLSPTQVAKTFIPPAQFAELCGRSHCVVVGPRGSGKTTLLKMLQLPALAAWQHEEADKYTASIDFTGVFVAADISWGKQLESLGGRNCRSDRTRAFGPFGIYHARIHRVG